MSRFLRYLAIPSICVALLGGVNGCCSGEVEITYPYIEFIIVDQAGDNVLVTNTLPASLIWCYREGNRAGAVNPIPDFDRGVFVMSVTPNYDHKIDIIDKPFVHLDLTFEKLDDPCGPYEQISGVSINGMIWDYHSNPVITLIYNP